MIINISADLKPEFDNDYNAWFRTTKSGTTVERESTFDNLNINNLFPKNDIQRTHQIEVDDDFIKEYPRWSKFEKI